MNNKEKEIMHYYVILFRNITFLWWVTSAGKQLFPTHTNWIELIFRSTLVTYVVLGEMLRRK